MSNYISLSYLFVITYPCHKLGGWYPIWGYYSTVCQGNMTRATQAVGYQVTRRTLLGMGNSVSYQSAQMEVRQWDLLMIGWFWDRKILYTCAAFELQIDMHNQTNVISSIFLTIFIVTAAIIRYEWPFKCSFVYTANIIINVTRYKCPSTT